MSKFSIIPNGGGTARYSGCPTFTGTYMKPGMLEFREIASPTPIDWEVGDYVSYTRTGFTYRLYGIPQVKKQARSTEYGGAFVYQSVQFFDDTKQLEICPFRDLVPDDNRIHFSTQPSISVFDNVAGIAERLQVCLEDMYGANSWVVRVATENGDHISHDLAVLMDEDRDFSVSGVNILQCLDKIYEIWPEVGWVYRIESNKNTIVIGGAGLTTTDSYEYGKGNGLKSITRIVANADEMATRIFAYGSSRNMLPGWYNSQNIKDADSVNIQNLMLPVDAIPEMNWSGWGKTLDGGTMKPDAAKAYLDADQTTMARLGLRPKTYYFDGTGDLPEIYPTIREMTIGEIRKAKGNDQTAPYYPNTSIYTNANTRVDTILTAPASFDSGMAGDGNGKETTYDNYSDASGSDSFTIDAGTRHYTGTIVTEGFTFASADAGIRDVSFSVDLSGTVQVAGIESAKVVAYLRKGHPANAALMTREFGLQPSPTTAGVYNFTSFTFSGSRKNIEAATYYLVLDLDLDLDGSNSSQTLSYSFTGGITANLANYRETTFKVSIRQIGFDINAQANLGDGKTIAMRSGKCAGRAFTIKTCTYTESTDSWLLEVIRSQDDSLSQWFPNTISPIVAGDEFILLDIAMPDEYILVAEQRLLAAAQELLADVSVERWQYTPDIDAKFMVENSRTILPAQNMLLVDENVVENGSVSILIDTVTINEGEAAIPTYKVTLRDRKKKTFTEAKGAEGISSNPVTNATQESIAQMSSRSADSYFTVDANGNITLKEQYDNLWVPGWLSAGGVGTGGGGGGGGLISTVYGVSSLGTKYSGVEDYSSTFSAKAIDTIYHGLQNTYTKTQVDNLIGTISSFSYEIYPSTSSVTNPSPNILYLIGPTGTGADKYEEYVYANNTLTKIGDTSVDLSNYVQKVSGATNGNFAALDSNGNLTDSGHSHADYLTSIGTSGDYLTYTKNGANNNITVPFATVASKTRFTPLYTGATEIEPLLDWFVPETFTENNATKYRLRLNPKYVGMYADGWVSAGGVGTGGGGGGGATWLSDLQDVGISSPQPGHILMYDPTQAKPWVNVPQSEITPDLSGYVPTTRTVNGHALSSNVTVTASDVGLGLVENVAISGWHGSTNITTLGTITTGTWSGTPIANSKLANSSMNIAGANVSLGGTLSSTSLKSNLGINTIESEIAKFNSWFSEDSNGNIFVNPKNGVARGFFTAGFLASGGFGESGGGSGSGGNDVAWGTSTQDSVQLTVDSVTFNLSKAGVTDHFSGYIGSTDSNQSIVLSSLEEYTDQSGRVSLTLGSASYLWVCLERDEFTIESEGIKVPMQYITTQSNVNCYVSAERLNAGVVNFVIKYDKIAKPDSEALVITARSYTITYGDALPDFSYTANGQVDGTPQITCSATSSSGAGTYAIVITRGTVTDANAVYENGTLTIAKANLIITADDKSIQLNGTMPTFTVSYSGFVHGETQRVLTALPTCTTNAQGTSTAGRYDIIPSGAVATNYSFTYVSGHLYIGYTILISWTSTQVSAAKSIGGYIAADTGKLMTSSVYYGTVIAVDGYQGCNVNFTRANGVSFFRYAFLKTCDSWVQGNTPNYSSQSGYTSQIRVNAASGEAEIPSDAKYMYVYIYSNGTNYAPSIEISGISNSKTIFLAASNFTANKTISADGTIYTGANAPTTWCTTNQLAIKGATFNYGLSALAAHIPSQFDSLEMNIAAYNATKAFTQRYTYKRIPATCQLAPGECYVHIMMIGIKNGSAVNISSVPIGDNDVQLIVKDE